MKIKSIKTVKERSKRFYDLNVSVNNNYVLDSGMVVHNTGYNFSNIRPKGSLVKPTGGEASGPLSFIRVFNEATETIKQGGVRRGANMGILNCTHPDILEFITAKKVDGDFNNFNFSIGISNKFMEAVLDDNHDIKMDFTGEIKNAKYIFDKLVHYAWLNGEPNVIFLDEINDKNKLKAIEHITSTNPSMPGNTLVYTRDGIFPIKKLEGKEFLIRSLDGRWAPAKCRKSGENKELIKITFDGNRICKATPKHRWPVLDEGTGILVKKYTKDLCIGDKTPLNHNKPLNIQGDMSLTEDEGFLLGIFIGDGWLCKRSDGSGYAMGFSINNKDYDDIGIRLLNIINSLKPDKSNLIGESEGSHSIQVTSKIFITYFMERFQLKDGKKCIPKIVWKSNDNFIRGFLDGLISSDGYADCGRFIYSTKDKMLAIKLSQLLGFLGIKGKLRTEVSDRKIGDYEYKDYKVYRVSVTSKLHIANLLTIVPNITCIRRKEALEEVFQLKVLKTQFTDSYNSITDIKPTASEDVWDISVYHKEHVFPIAYGYTGNCGEVPLPFFGSCNLGSINLVKVVKNRKINYEKLDKLITNAVVFLDSIINVTKYSLPEIKEQALYTRRIGLGVMGFHDMLILMGIKYSSEKAIALSEKLAYHINTKADKVSTKLGKTLGYYEAYNQASEEDKKKLPKRRNGILTTVAPTGTLSMLANCSGGIEPNFAYSYTRTSADKTEVVIHDLAKQWIKDDESLDYNSIILELLEGKPIKDVVDLHSIFEDASEITPEQHIRIQAAWQSNIENSISKTINLESDATEKDIHDAYVLGWKLGCKGLTVYRDGSRSGQVYVKDSKVKEEIKVKKVSKLPRILDAKRVMVLTGCGNLYVKISFHPDTKKPMEVFCSMSKGGSCNGTHMQAIGRLISSNLRHGGSIDDSIKQLQGLRCPNPIFDNQRMNLSCEDAISRALNYFSDNKSDNEAILGKRCKVCDSLNTVVESGCMKCLDCGDSACG